MGVTAPIQKWVDRRWDRSKMLFEQHGMYWRLLWAAKFAFLGCLPAAILINDDTANSILTPPFVTISFIVVTTAGTCGRGVANLLLGMKIVAISYAMVTVCLALDVGAHWLAWGVVFALGTFLIALLSEFVVTMNTTLIFIIGMLNNILRDGYGGRSRTMFSSYQVRDVLCGVALGFLSSALPFSCDEFNQAVACDTSVSGRCRALLELIVQALIADTNAQRTSLLIHIRRERTALQSSIATLKGHITFAWHEPVEGLYVAELENRASLYAVVFDELASFAGLVEVVRSRDYTSFHSFLGQRPLLLREVENVCDAASSMLEAWLARRKSSDDNASIERRRCELIQAYARAPTEVDFLQQHTEVSTEESHAPLVQLITPLEDEQGSDGQMISFDNEATSPMNSKPVERTLATCMMGFAVYKLDSLLYLLQAYEPPEIWDTQRKISEVLMWPVREVKQVLHLLVDVFHWRGRGPTKFVFAVKLSLCLTAFCAYLLRRDVGEPFFGPAQMAFAAGLDSSKAVSIFGSQVIGCVLGTVVGYLLSTACHSTVEFVVAITAGALVTGYFRSSSEFAVVAIYSQFAFFGALRVWPSPDEALSSILTNTAAMGLYTIVQLLFFPAEPWDLLRREMVNVLHQIQQSLRASHELLLCQPEDTASAQAGREPNNSLPEAPFGIVYNADRVELRRAFRSVLRQTDLLPSAAAQPRLSQSSFPVHLVERVIRTEQDVLNVLVPMTSSWRQLMEASFIVAVPELAEAIQEVSRHAEVFIERTMALLCTDHCRVDPFRDDIGRAFGVLEAASNHLLETFKDTFDRSVRSVTSLAASSTLPDGVAAKPHLLDTVLYTCQVLPGILFQLYRVVCDLHDATKYL